MKSTTDVVPKVYNIGERFAQLVIVPIPEFDIVEVEELSGSERGEDGLGSTGDTNISAAAEDQSPSEDATVSANEHTVAEEQAAPETIE